MSIRQDLVSSAVTFLRDPSVAQSPLAKRLQFLESKGLTPPETDEALRQASSGSFAAATYGSQQQRGRYNNAEEVARDWRDWFIMTVIGGGVGYLAISLARKYLLPALQPPTQTDLEEAQAVLAQKYDEAAAILSTLQLETDALKGEMTAQSAKVDGAVKEVRDAMETCMKGETERDEEMEKIKEEVDALKELLPRALEKQKEAQTASLTDLQNELKSLKSLLLSRRNEGASPAAGPATSAPSPGPAAPPSRSPVGGPNAGRFGYTNSPAFAGLGSRPPGIPAWQLAANANPGSSTTPPPAASPNGTLNGIDPATEASAVPKEAPPITAATEEAATGSSS